MTSPERWDNHEPLATPELIDRVQGILADASNVFPEADRLTLTQWAAGRDGYYESGIHRSYQTTTGHGDERHTSRVFAVGWPAEGDPTLNASIGLYLKYKNGMAVTIRRRLTSETNKIMVRQGNGSKDLSGTAQNSMLDIVYGDCTHSISEQDLNVQATIAARLLGETATRKQVTLWQRLLNHISRRRKL